MLQHGNTLAVRRPFSYLLIQMTDRAVRIGSALVMLPGFARLTNRSGKQ